MQMIKQVRQVIAGDVKEKEKEKEKAPILNKEKRQSANQWSLIRSIEAKTLVFGRLIEQKLKKKWDLLGDFEDAQKTHASKNRHAERFHHVHVGQHDFGYGADHDETVESIEQRHKVSLQAERVHLQEHLERKQNDKEDVGVIWASCNWN